MSGKSGVYETKGRANRRHISNGYVEVYAPEHPNAHAAGWLYEHRYIMTQMLGRALRIGEIVHHRNGNALDNSPMNLELKHEIGEHKVVHRSPDSRLRLPDEVNKLVPCRCGCGQMLWLYDGQGRPRRRLPNHSWRKGKRSFNTEAVSTCACGCKAEFKQFDRWGRERRFVAGHNGR